jgi:hypothetical protein
MIACRPYIIASCPQLAAPVRSTQAWELSVQLPRRNALQHIHHLRGRISRRTTDEQVYVIQPHRQYFHFPVPRCANLADQFLQPLRYISRQHLAAIPWYPDEVVGQSVDCVSSSPCFHGSHYSITRSHHPNVAYHHHQRTAVLARRGPAFLPAASDGVSGRRIT